MDKLTIKEKTPFKIVLEGHGSTGYLWVHEPDSGRLIFKKYDNDDKLVVNQSQDNPPEPVVGSSPNEEFYFLPFSAGVHQVSFLCRRPWDTKDVAFQKTFEVEVEKA